MSRGKGLFTGYAKDVYIGKEWICDICGDIYRTNQFMPDVACNDKHICKSCVLKGIVEYLSFEPSIQFRNLNVTAKSSFVSYCGDNYKITCEKIPAKDKRRKAIHGLTRKKVLSGGKCAHCGSKEDLQVDHITPVSKGGTNHIGNLQALCGSCNRKKGVN
jgi:hypothetical protein